MNVAGRFMLSALLLLTAAPAPGQQGGDLQAQILYAYETEDAHSLVNLVQDLTTRVNAGEEGAPLRYHLAHAQYRRGLLASAADPREAEAALSDCIDQLKAVMAHDVKSAEVLILQSACYGELADHEKLQSVLLRSRAEERLKVALKQEPRNPRAVFLASTEGLRQGKPGTAERQRAFAQLLLAVQLFDASSATSIDTPGWGHAEAYLRLGQQLQSQGDPLGARNWIEKALIVAPDYKAAQRQLALLVRP
jgi:hypothetical protein